MTPHRHPDPATLLHGIPGLPRWLFLCGASMAAGCMLAGVGMIVYLIGWAETDEPGILYGVGGGALGCLLGGAGAMFGVLRDGLRRLPAIALLHHVQHDRPIPLYRVAFLPALAVFVVVAALALTIEGMPANGLLQASGLMAFLAGTLEAVRRHTTRQARDVLARYAAGTLDAANVAAIDAARAHDASFDAGLRAYLGIPTS